MQRYAYDRSNRTYSADGHLHVSGCNISKANVCPYYGREIPNFQALGLDPNRIYRLYRDPEELRAAADSFRNLPLLIRHVPVTADFPQRDSWVGTVGSDISFDGTYLRAGQLSVWTQDAIGLIETDAQRELSSSYRYTADMTPGVHPEYGAYDGVMRNIIGNHVAMVEEGRAGSDVRIEDSLPVELKHMGPKRKARLILAAAALGITAPTETQLLALDAAIPPIAADAESCGAWDGWSPESRARAMDAWRSANNVAADASLSAEQEQSAWDWAKDRAPQYAPPGASDRRPQPAPAPAPALTAADIAAAEQRASDAAVARVTALYAARDAVRPYVGDVVACDTAEAVYRFALDQMGCKDGKTVHASALPVLFAAVAANRQQAQTNPVARPAMDGTARANLFKALPGLQNFTVAH